MRGGAGGGTSAPAWTAGARLYVCPLKSHVQFQWKLCPEPEAVSSRARWNALPFADGELSGYRAEKVLHAVPDPGLALTEARRVLAPGGRIVLAGQDWEAIVIDSADMTTTSAAVQARAATIPSPHAARRYRNLLLDNEFVDVEVEVHTGVFTDAMILPVLVGLAEAARSTGAITADEAEAWTADQQRRAETGRLFCALPIFLTTATKP
ncbi:methyltransferase domain-containing protein [Saccharopolyspora sp. NPDC002376]